MLQIQNALAAYMTSIDQADNRADPNCAKKAINALTQQQPAISRASTLLL